MQALSSALSLLGNRHESSRSHTKSAISQNIAIQTKTPENLTALSRDTKNANEQVQKQDLQKVQEQQEMAKVIGEIVDNGISIATFEKREALNKLSLEKFQAEEKYGKDSPQAKALGTQMQALQQQLDQEFGLGSEKGMAIRAVTAALQSTVQQDKAGAITALASPYLNREIHKLTEGDSTKEKAANLMAHALLSAVEFQVTGKDPLTGAMAGVTGEATAQYLTKALYNKAPSELTANEKETISSLSQLAGGLAGAFTAKVNGSGESQGGGFLSGVAGAETAKRAVENNYLSVLSQKRRDEIREKIKNGQASRKEIVEYLQYEKADHTSDYLVDKARHRPEEMTSQEWAEYENYAKRYVSESIKNREIPQDIERNLKEILTGNYYKGYGYAYALDEKYRSNLPSRWFSSDLDKSAEEKMYENLNAKYIQNPRTLRESFNGRVAESTKEGLELAATLYTGNILTAAGLSVANKLGPVGKQLATTAEKYPLLTDIGTTAIANTAYQLSQNKPYDPYSLLQSELSTVLTRGKTLGQQLSINVGISTMATENPDDYGWNALGAFTGTVGTKIMSQANFNKNNSQFLKSVITGTIAEGIGDPTNLKQQYKNIKDIKNENLKE